MCASPTVNAPMPLRRSLAAVIVVALTVAAAPLGGQTPYAPVAAEPGAVTLSLDMQAHAAPARANGWVWALPGVSVGLPRGVTLGARASRFQPLATRATWDLVPQASWLVVDDTARALRLGLTALGLVPLGAGAAARDAFAIGYATAAWTARATGTTLVAGGYLKADRTPIAGEARRGVILEAAQPLPRLVDGVDLGLAASWFQGRNLFGYATLSLQAQVGRWFVSAGWARGNDPRYNTGPTLSLAVPW